MVYHWTLTPIVAVSCCVLVDGGGVAVAAVICGDGGRPVDAVPHNAAKQQQAGRAGNVGGYVHGHTWDPDYR